MPMIMVVTKMLTKFIGMPKATMPPTIQVMPTSSGSSARRVARTLRKSIHRMTATSTRPSTPAIQASWTTSSLMRWLMTLMPASCARGPSEAASRVTAGGAPPLRRPGRDQRARRRRRALGERQHLVERPPGQRQDHRVEAGAEAPAHLGADAAALDDGRPHGGHALVEGQAAGGGERDERERRPGAHGGQRVAHAQGGQPPGAEAME